MKLQPDGTALRLFDIPTGAKCPFFLSASVLPPDMKGVRRVASGRGLTRDDARLNCRREALERLAAIHDPARDIVCSSLEDARPGIVDPESLILLSDQQYRGREEWNENVGAEHHWPDRIDPGKLIQWTPARSVLKGFEFGEEVFLPSAVVFLGYENALAEGFPVPDSNGLASGSSLKDAAQRALLEIVERDAVAIWWYNQIEVRSVCFDPEIWPLHEAFRRWVDSTGRLFWILDLTSDLGIPVAAAVSSNKEDTDISIGFGAGRTMEAATISAMGELVQYEASKANLQRNAALPDYHFISVLSRSTRSTARHLFPNKADSSLYLEPEMKFSPEDPLNELAACNLAPLLVDLSTDEISVVRMVIPGMRPIWPRFAQGRLYTTPVETSHLSTAKKESELNAHWILY